MRYHSPCITTPYSEQPLRITIEELQKILSSLPDPEKVGSPRYWKFIVKQEKNFGYERRENSRVPSVDESGPFEEFTAQALPQEEPKNGSFWRWVLPAIEIIA